MGTTSYDAIDPGRQPGADLDTDRDGLTDAFERLAGSRPDVADTDQDGLSDAYEVGVSHSSVLLADSDADRVTDADRVATLGTSPTAFDSDRDGRRTSPGVAPAAASLRPSGRATRQRRPAVTDAFVGGRDRRAELPGQGPVGEGRPRRRDPGQLHGGSPPGCGDGSRHRWHVIQGSFSDDVSASGSTHAGGGVVDIAPTNGDWEGAVTALRKIGFSAWIRNAPGHGYAGSGEHIHAVLMGDEQIRTRRPFRSSLPERRQRPCGLRAR